MQNKKKVVIIGGGPAGLTAAYELSQHPEYDCVVYEATDGVGGISRTFEYHGNRIDIGGHRFFSKSDRVMQWWQTMLPIQRIDTTDAVQVTYQQKQTVVSVADGPDPTMVDAVMLVRPRLSRIYYLRKFFQYPVSLSVQTIQNLGIVQVIKIGFSYVYARLFPIRDEKNLEDFFINRFGDQLYRTFFKDYTKKVWGIPASDISPDWGRQRVKGLSISAALKDAIKKLIVTDTTVSQKNTETSLIEQFLYPKYGPGQMWETVKTRAEERGVHVVCNAKVVALTCVENRITHVTVQRDGQRYTEEVAYVISSMPITALLQSMGEHVPAAVKAVGMELKYRDFVTVGLLLKKLRVTAADGISLIPDTWIYVQEPEVQLGRIQIFNNWSPYLVADPENTVWIGLEYFCDAGDDIWSKSDTEMISFAVEELALIDFIHPEDVLDAVVIRVPKTYPTYFGAYDQFAVVREFVDTIPNLFLTGRNGMHRYNNQDHSMLTAMAAVENIVSGRTDKSNIWDINVEQEYHEKK